jgi:hypothetical protein
MSTKIGYFDCFAGAAGDMIVGSIIDAGVDPAAIMAKIGLLALPPVELKITAVERHGLKGTKADFLWEEEQHQHRGIREIEKLLHESRLEDAIADQVLRVFGRLGEAEAKVHGIPIESVHFHEVGAVDAICDIVAAVVGIRELGIDKLFSSQLLLGSGTTRSAHGIIPLPAPATLELVKDFPCRRIDSGVEMTTPTGAAIITTLAEYSDEIEIVAGRIGYGAGARDPEDRPGLLRLIVGEAVAGRQADNVSIIETNIDDCTPEELGHLQTRLLRKGALDVFITPVMMKKSRPAWLITVICEQHRLDSLTMVLLRESSTAGVRYRTERRRKLARKIVEVETSYGKIRIKFLYGPNVLKFSPEYDDVAAAADAAGVPLSWVERAARQAALEIEGEVT